MSCSYRYEHWPCSPPPPPPPFMWQNNELLLQIWTLTMFKHPTPTLTPHLCDKTMSCSYRYEHWPCSSTPHPQPPPPHLCDKTMSCSYRYEHWPCSSTPPSPTPTPHLCDKTMSCSYRYEHWPCSSTPIPHPHPPFMWQNNELLLQIWTLTMFKHPPSPTPNPHLCDKTMSCSYRYEHWPCSSTPHPPPPPPIYVTKQWAALTDMNIDHVQAPHPPFMWQSNELLLQIWTLTMFKPPLNECSLIYLLVSLTLEIGVNGYVRTWLFFQKTRRRIWTKG